MKLRIDNKDLFEGKEHYLSFRAAWARNSRGPSAAQHLLYVLLRGHDAYASFTPVSNENKLKNGMAYTHGIYYAMLDLKNAARWARNYDNDSKHPHSSENLSKKWTDRFLAPFEGTITPEMLIKAVEMCEEVPLVFASYGIGRLIHMKSDFKPIDYSKFWDMYEDARPLPKKEAA